MSEAPIFTARDGKVFYRGTYKDEQERVRLLGQFEATAHTPGDWFASRAGQLADELRQAIRAADHHQQPHTLGRA
jgi:hypothetical protein